MRSWTTLISHASNVTMLLKTAASIGGMNTDILERTGTIIFLKDRSGRHSKLLVKADASYVLKVQETVVSVVFELVVPFSSVEEATQELGVLFMARNI